MKKILEDKLSAAKAILALLKANPDVTGKIPAFAGAITKLEAYIGDINSKNIVFRSATSGKAEAKLRAEDDLVDAIVTVAASLAIYADENDDFGMEPKVDVTAWSLRKLRDTELISKGNEMRALAEPIIDKLADTSITAETLADLKAKTEAFDTAMGQRESSVPDRSSALQALKASFAQMDVFLKKKLDKLLEIARNHSQQFYDAYESARQIRQTGIRHAPDAPPPAKA